MISMGGIVDGSGKMAGSLSFSPQSATSAASGTIVVNAVTDSSIDCSIDLTLTTGEHLQTRIAMPFCDQNC